MEQVPLGLPSNVLPSMSAVLSADATSQYTRVNPNNVNSLSSPVTAVSTSATVPTQISFPSTPIQFTIPSGQSSGTFIDHSKSTLQFRVKYELVGAATTPYTSTSAFLQGSAFSWFNRISELISGQVVDDRTSWDLACNSDLQWSMDLAARDSNVLSYGLRGEAETIDNLNSCQGHSIPAFTGVLPAANTVNYYSYAVPLKSALIGADAKSMFPIGRCSGRYDVTLYTPALAPITLINSGEGAGAGATVQVTIDQICIELFYLNLDQRSASLLPAVGRPWALHGVTSRVGNGSVPALANSAVSIQVPLRAKSVRSLSARFSDSVISTVGSVNGQYDSKCPLVSAMSYLIAGTKRMPNVPLSSQFSIANIFNHTMQAYSDSPINRLQSKCGLAFDGFSTYWTTAAAPTAALNFDQNVIAAGSSTTVNSLAGFEFAEDLRICSSNTFLNGTDMTSSNSFLELNIINAPTANQNVAFIAKCDAIFIIMPDGNVEVRI